MKDENIPQDDKFFRNSFGVSMALKSICFGILVYFGIYEIRTRRAFGSSSSYFSSFWNIFDCVFIPFYIPVFIFDILDYFDYQYFADSVSKILLCIFVFMAFIKFYFYLRIYNGFSSLVYMLQQVFWDLRYFLALYAFIIMSFGVQFSIIFNGTTQDTYDGVS